MEFKKHKNSLRHLETKLCLICDENKSLIILHKTRRQTHCICEDCLTNYLNHNIENYLEILQGDNNKRKKNDYFFTCLSCPGFMNKKCNKKIILNEIIKSDSLFFNSLQRIYFYLFTSTSIFCKNKNCKDIIILENDYHFDEINCFSCKISFCKKCNRIPYHKNKTCLEVELEEKKTENSLYINSLIEKNIMKLCPNCKTPIMKDNGCNKMKCQYCHIKWCWLCFETNIDYDHYNNTNSNKKCKGKLWEGVDTNL